MNIPTEAIATSLEMRANYIESGDVNLSTNDLRERARLGKPLTHEQISLVMSLRNAAENLRTGKLKIVRG